ncbi:methylenetetrahydrofolate reductase [Shimia ponticola]|uniref:methylenetetrahydrofolate reductase n=1 Tax=Shimia ponticola TaxID=2582893 RepID=UPI0011BE7D64|nr:methylenetetrahydrofolate reductase [Shimia ponticola]
MSRHSNPPVSLPQRPTPAPAAPPVKLSFEYFPPRDLQASFRLWEAVQALSPFAPAHVSVTYGAGGTTRDLTHETVETLQSQGTDVAAHLTCVGASRDDTLAVADRYMAAGVNKIVALRGDMPDGGPFTPHPHGFGSSITLIEALAKRGFEVHAGAYPDCHPDAANPSANIDWLKAKIDAGASTAITQFFFKADTFLRFRDACAAAGITAPIVPGILPVHSWKQVERFAVRCGTPVPDDIAAGFETAARDDRHDLFALAHATELCSDLRDEGVDHLHFYTLNRPDLTRDVLRALGCPAQKIASDTFRNVA